MKLLTDKFPFQVPVKCSGATIRPKVVIFTSNVSLDTLYGSINDGEHFEAIKRRFTTEGGRIIHMARKY